MQKNGTFQLQNRRYLGNKYKLLSFIEDVVTEKCGLIGSFFDIFAGTGVVGERFNKPGIKVISNDILLNNFICLKAFLETKSNIIGIAEKISYLNNLTAIKDNYFSQNFGNAYFSMENAEKIGTIRDEIENIFETEEEKNVLICSLIYAVDKVANTVGHYDAYRKDMDMVQPIQLFVPDICYENNESNEIFNEDANTLIRKITCDVLYIDPPYNSRQYSDAYHLLENLAEWRKPKVIGIARKMDRAHIKSSYCLKDATTVFEDLIQNASCKHILLSYNNTAEKKDDRSNARISDYDILRILKTKGDIEIFEKEYKAFTAGKSTSKGNTERLFYCKVR
jgi:adenine-specific DNA-methyltransferase